LGGNSRGPQTLTSPSQRSPELRRAPACASDPASTAPAASHRRPPPVIGAGQPARWRWCPREPLAV